MQDDNTVRERLVAKRIAHDIHEMTYLKHVTGASDPDIRSAIKKVGNDRVKIERELERRGTIEARQGTA